MFVDKNDDKRNFSLVVKTAPVPYHSKNKISPESKHIYFKLRDNIKHELKKNQQHNWKIKNHYLQIANLPIQSDSSLHQLRTDLQGEVQIIAIDLDRIMAL